MNVLHLYKTYFPDTIGGVEQVINQLVLSTSKLGVNSTILALSKEPSVKQPISLPHHEVYQCQSQLEIASTPFSITAFKHFKQLAKKADVVHYHFPYPFADFLHFSCAIDKPSLVSYHSDIVKQKWLLKLYNPLQQRFLKDVNHIVCASPNYARSSEVLAQFQEKTHVIPYGLDLSSYPLSSTERCDAWRRKLGDKFFLFVGVTRYYKGLHILLNAAQDTHYPIVILGSGPEEVALKQQAQRLGLSNILFLGFLPKEDKIAILSICFAFVFPSHLRSEAFGISLLESAMFGKPMISCEIGTGTSYINQHNITGLVIKPNNSNELKQAMNRLWNDEAMAKQMGEQALLRYHDKFSSTQMANKYHSLYERMLS